MAVRILFLGRVFSDPSEVSSGGQIRDYYIRLGLTSQYPQTICALKKGGNPNVRTILSAVGKRTLLWVEFPTSLRVEWLAAFLSLAPWFRIVLDVHDLPIEQTRALGGRDPPFLRRLLLRVPERFLFLRCERAAVVPGLKGMLPAYARGKAMDLPAGCTIVDGSPDPASGRLPRSRKLLLYTGGITVGRILEPVLEAIARQDAWDLVVVGFGDSAIQERLRAMRRVIYLGRRPYSETRRLLEEVDAIVVPYPRGPYFDGMLPAKVPDSLAAGKPVIMTRLPFIEAYVRKLGLEGNAIFVDRLTTETVLSSLDRASRMVVDRIKSVEVMRRHTWEEIERKVLPVLVEGG